jgi:DNA-damage-inducible protein J
MSHIQNEVVRARVSPALKHNAERVLDKIGMSMTEAIRLFLTQISLRQEFPLELKIPNQTTLQALSATPTDEIYHSADELFDEVLSDFKD